MDSVTIRPKKTAKAMKEAAPKEKTKDLCCNRKFKSNGRLNKTGLSKKSTALNDKSCTAKPGYTAAYAKCNGLSSKATNDLLRVSQDNGCKTTVTNPTRK